jgi:hypothetical protein
VRTPATKPDESRVIEPCYTPAEISELWKVNERTVRRTFEKEPGVLLLGGDRRKTMRIPQSVFERVCRLRCNPLMPGNATAKRRAKL